MKLLKTYAACTALAILTACGSNKKIAEVWEKYERTDFAYLSSESENGAVSELLEHYPIREKVLSLERH